jgi:hypothetical protein
VLKHKVGMAGALLGALVGLVVFAGAAAAGTCVPVTVKGHGPDPATATTKASVKLTQRAATLRGKVKNSSTNCRKMPGGFECTTSAVVCP